MKNVLRVREVINDRKATSAKETRATLFQRCREAADEMQDDIAGFALVVWDGEGNLRSAYDATRGPIKAPLVPTLAADSLNRHLAVMLAKAEISGEDEL